MYIKRHANLGAKVRVIAGNTNDTPPARPLPPPPPLFPW